MSRYPVIVVPFMQVAAMAIFPFILVKEEAFKTDEVLIRHEIIHLKQEAELLVLPFYLLYLINYLANRIIYKEHQKAYENICFEREAYACEFEDAYLSNRKFWAWLKYIQE